MTQSFVPLNRSMLFTVPIRSQVTVVYNVLTLPIWHTAILETIIGFGFSFYDLGNV